jgi:hypothetical protein
MPNLAFHVKVLDQAIKQLGSDPLAAPLSSNRRFAVLGAMGPDLLRYRPVGKDLASTLAGLVGSNQNLMSLSDDQLQELMAKPMGGAYSVLFSALVLPVWPVLGRISDFLDKMDAIAAPNNEDANALQQAQSEAQSIQNDINSLQSLRPKLESLTQVIGQIVIQRPRIQLDPTSIPQDLLPSGMYQKFPSLWPMTDPSGNRLHEFLRWHRPGKFAKELHHRAQQSNNPKLQAYALGWLCHFASSVTAEPAVNNITGGPYRTHWWRNRLVGNFIDSWTYGYYQSSTPPTMNGDDPSPPYDQWPSICSANLQDEFNIAGLAGPQQPHDVPDAVKAMADGTVGALPELTAQDLTDVANLLLDTVNAVYPTTPPALPNDSLPPLTALPGFTLSNIKEAFAGAYAVYWFMTSGSGPLANNVIGPPPSTAPTPPSWVSSGSPPTSQQAYLDHDAVVCAIVLAIILALAILTGALLLGIIALIALMNTSVIDWVKVRDTLYWMRKMLVDAQNAIRDALVWAGMAYPPPLLLGMVDADGHTLPVTDLSPPNPAAPQNNVPATLGLPLCHTSLNEVSLASFPTQMDLRVTALVAGNTVAVPDVNFAVSPFLPPTQAKTSPTDREDDNLPASGPINQPVPAGRYPNYFVEVAPDATAPLIPLNAGILTKPRIFPSPALKAGVYVSCGSAVFNAVHLIKNSVAIATDTSFTLPNYNLDGDHGYGWLTWEPFHNFNPTLARPTPIYLAEIIVSQEQ